MELPKAWSHVTGAIRRSKDQKYVKAFKCKPFSQLTFGSKSSFIVFKIYCSPIKQVILAKILK